MAITRPGVALLLGLAAAAFVALIVAPEGATYTEPDAGLVRASNNWVDKVEYGGEDRAPGQWKWNHKAVSIADTLRAANPFAKHAKKQVNGGVQQQAMPQVAASTQASAAGAAPAAAAPAAPSAAPAIKPLIPASSKVRWKMERVKTELSMKKQVKHTIAQRKRKLKKLQNKKAVAKAKLKLKRKIAKATAKGVALVKKKAAHEKARKAKQAAKVAKIAAKAKAKAAESAGIVAAAKQKAKLMLDGLKKKQAMAMSKIAAEISTKKKASAASLAAKIAAVKKNEQAIEKARRARVVAKAKAKLARIKKLAAERAGKRVSAAKENKVKATRMSNLAGKLASKDAKEKSHKRKMRNHAPGAKRVKRLSRRARHAIRHMRHMVSRKLRHHLHHARKSLTRQQRHVFRKIHRDVRHQVAALRKAGHRRPHKRRPFFRVSRAEVQAAAAAHQVGAAHHAANQAWRQVLQTDRAATESAGWGMSLMQQPRTKSQRNTIKANSEIETEEDDALPFGAQFPRLKAHHKAAQKVSSPHKEWDNIAESISERDLLKTEQEFLVDKELDKVAEGRDAAEGDFPAEQ